MLVWHIGDTVDDQKMFENVQQIIMGLQAQGIECDHQLIPKNSALDRVNKELKSLRPFRPKSIEQLERSKAGVCVRTWEAAAYLGVSEKTVGDWCRQGKVKAHGGREESLSTNSNLGRGENWCIAEREIARVLREREIHSVTR